MKEKQITIIDGNWLMYRSYHSTINWYYNKNYNAIWGFKRTMKLLEKMKPQSKVCIVFDSEKSFRYHIDKNYKAQRSKMPEGLLKQFPLLKAELKQNKISIFQKDFLEGDDLIGILCNKLKDKIDKIYIVTPDKDMNQLLSNKVIIIKYKNKKWIEYTKEDLLKEYGIYPNQFIDYLTIVGDTADNVSKGIPGIGPKKASLLLQKYKSLENIPLYSQYEEILTKNKKLITLKTSL